MKLLVVVLGFTAFLLFGLHALAPLFGFEDGIIADWAVGILFVVSLPLGARMVVLRYRARREAREKAARR